MALLSKASLLPLIAAFSLAASLAYGESAVSSEDLQAGTALFSNGLYDNAVMAFRNVTKDKTADNSQKASAYFWIAKSYMALGKLNDADTNLELYLSNYPNGADYPEALYQKGRLLFLQEEYENTIQVLQGFLTAFPQSPFVSNAYYWVGESLFNLGKLDEAVDVFRKIVREYPTGYKVEAAQYRLSLIELSRKEIELTKLLQWSHEEFLKNASDYQQRERTYVQAIDSLQKRLANIQPQYEKTIAGLQAALDKQTTQVNRLTTQIQTLQAQVSAQPAGTAPSPQEAVPPAAPAAGAAAAPTGVAPQATTPSGAAPQQPAAGAPSVTAADLAAQAKELEKQKQTVELTLRLLAIKGQALALKETYLNWLESNGGIQR
jgi:TolA-binding protein/uncharacterized coiled-coil protein SlyX